MKRIFQINVTANQGSTGRIAEQIGEKVLGRHWFSEIAYGRGNPRSASELYRIGNDMDMRWHGLKTRLFDNHGLASSSATHKLVDEMTRFSPDLVHLHNIHGYFVNYEILFSYFAEAGIPVVWTLHDCWAMTGHCPHFEAAGCERWIDGCYSCPEKKSYPASYVFDSSRSNYLRKKAAFTSLEKLTIVTPSQWLAGIVRRSFLKQYPVEVINNGVDLDVFQPSVGKQRGRVLGVASVWSQRKGFADFIALRELLPADEYEIVLVGLSSSQIKKLPAGIKGIERTENMQQLVDLYSSSEVFVNPTYEDTFPTTNIEALACGTPVITYRSGGSPEIISPSTGTVVEKGNVQGLADAIKYYHTLGNDGLGELSVICRNRAGSFYDRKERFEEYLSLYIRLLADKEK